MLDLFIVGLFIAAMLVFGFFRKYRARTFKDFTLGSRNYQTPVLLAAIFATLIGGFLTIGITGYVFSSGLSALLPFLGIPISRLLIGLFVAPKMNRFFGLLTAGDIMKSLYGTPAKVATGIASVLSDIFILGAQASVLGFLFNYFFGISYEAGVLIGMFITAFYSAAGGIRSVTVTDVLQFGIIMIAIPALCALGLYKIGGFSVLVKELPSGFLSLPKLLGTSKEQLGLCIT